MLEILKIKDLAIVEELELPFSSGLNVLTGETGAGKSILVGAIQLILGWRASQEMVRKGSDQAVVEAVFGCNEALGLEHVLEGYGIPTDPQGLVVRRVITREGRSRAYLNGALCNLKTLSHVCSKLVDISGQHEFQQLMDRDSHLYFLDSYGSLTDLRSKVGDLWRELGDVKEERRKLERLQRELAERQDFLKFQINEIDALNLVPGEERELEQERLLLKNAEKLVRAAVQAAGLLYEGDASATELMARAEDELAVLGEMDPILSGLKEAIERARLDVEEAAAELRTYAARTEADPARLEEVESRLDAISRLSRKHGSGTESILEKREAMARELEDLADTGERLEELAEKERRLADELAGLALELSRLRREYAVKLAGEMTAAVKDLGMPDARFEVEIKPVVADDAHLRVEGSAIGATGCDRVEFLFGPNPGEGLNPLVKIASGGELSRTMLALKRVFMSVDPVDTYVFDEVDAGIGGETAPLIAGALKNVATRHQVLCVTHLPHVAAAADAHFVVEKSQRGKRTVSMVQRLEKEESRLDELSRMLGDRNRASDSRKYAARILEEARDPNSPSRKQ